MSASRPDESDVVISRHPDQDMQGPCLPELHENPHALASFVRRAPVALAMFDQTMRYVAVSRSWSVMFDTGDRDLVGSLHYEVFPNLPKRWREAHEKALQGAHLSVTEAPWHRADGTISWHRWELTPWQNDSGSIGGVILFIENVTTPRAIDGVLRLLSVEAAGLEFAEFARRAIRRLAEILEMDMVQLSVPCADAPGWLETVAVFSDGEPAPNYRYQIDGTPCADAVRYQVCVFAEEVQARFPDDDDLVTCHIESYGGSVLTGSRGEMLGVLSVMSRTPFRNPEMVRAVISLAGVGIGGLLQTDRAKAAIKANEQFNRALLDAMNSHIAVMDGDGKIIFANEAWFAFARKNGADPVATGIGADYVAACEAAAITSTEALEATTLLRDVLSGRRSEGTCEYPCPTPSGMSWFRCTIKRFTDLDKAMVLASHEDISDIKLVTRRSQEVETKFRHLFHDAPDAALIVDAEGMVRLANRQAELMYRFAPGTLVDLPMATLISKGQPSRRGAVVEDFATRLASSANGSVWGETRGRRSDGSDFPAEATLSRFVEDDETLYILAVRDISLRLAAEDDRMARQLAEQANQAKSVFLATMSHEIRTPLNAVLGFAEVLSHSALDKDQSALLQHMRGSAQHLLGLIDNVLDLSKIEAGELALDHEAFDLPELILESARALSAYARQRNVRISLFIDPAMPGRFTSDPSRLRQVVYNLMGNAIKFSVGRANPGQVFVRAEMAGETEPMLQMTVRDNGIGMNEAVRTRVFNPFMQGESTITRRFGGTGLGLAITKRIVDRLCGQIMVDSVPDVGSTFRVLLPLQVAASQPTPLPQRLKDTHCLLAEGEAYLAEDLARYLHHEGATVTRLPPDAGSAAMQAAAEKADVLIAGSDFVGADALRAALPRILLCDRAADLNLSGTDSAADSPHDGTTCLRTELLTCSALVDAVKRAAGVTSPGVPAPEVPPVPDRHNDATTPRFRASQYLPILVVEDDLMNQKVILRQLALLGLEPDLAENGAVALEMWQKKSYGLILADLHMPVMDGYAMTAAIRAQEGAGLNAGRPVSIVALTANVLRDEIGRTRDAGFDGFMTKPMTLLQLADTLGAYLTPVDRAH